MDEKADSNRSFWTTLPGILTAFAGLLAAVTGLISVLVTAGVIGPGGNSNNAQQPANVATVKASAPQTAPSADPELDRFKTLAGKWEVFEEPSQYFGDNVKRVTWHYDAVVSGNQLTLSGKLYAVDNDKNLDEHEEKLRATYVTTLTGQGGVGEYRLSKPDGSTEAIPANIRLGENLTTFEGSFEVKGMPLIRLTGRKQP